MKGRGIEKVGGVLIRTINKVLRSFPTKEGKEENGGKISCCSAA